MDGYLISLNHHLDLCCWWGHGRLSEAVRSSEKKEAVNDRVREFGWGNLFLFLFINFFHLFYVSTTVSPPSFLLFPLHLPSTPFPIHYSSVSAQKGAVFPQASAKHDTSNWGLTKSLPMHQCWARQPSMGNRLPNPTQGQVLIRELFREIWREVQSVLEIWKILFVLSFGL